MSEAEEREDLGGASLVWFGLLILSGFVAIGLGWRLVAREAIVAYQVPAVVSGALGGLGVIVIGLACLNAQVSRRVAARERAATDALMREILVSLESGERS